jgi:hypothetical protein
LYDVAVIITAHDGMDYEPLIQAVDRLVDTRNALVHCASEPDQVWKA